jgi:hypothetical protein
LPSFGVDANGLSGIDRPVMFEQLVRLLAELGKRILTDPQIVQQLMGFFHLSSTSREARHQREQLDYAAAHIDEFSADLNDKLVNYASELEALTHAWERIKQLVRKGGANPETIVTVDVIRKEVNTRNKTLRLGPLTSGELEDLDLAPLHRERQALVTLRDRLDHPNKINPLPVQLLRLAREIEQFPASVAASMQEAIAPPQRVWFASSSPRFVRPGDEFVARFGAYIEAYEEEIARRLKEIGRRAKPQLRAQKATLVPGTEVTVRAEGDEWVDINEPQRSFVWDGTWDQVDFPIKVRKDTPLAHVIRLKFKITVADFFLSLVLATVDVRSGGHPSERQLNKAKIFRTYFASYAREDWDEVAHCIEDFECFARGVEFWTDQMDLVSGERWQERLEEEIRNREAFALFWSEYANQSEYVQWEIDQALKYKDDDHITIKLLSSWKPENTIPDKLKHLHFGHWGKQIRTADSGGNASPRQEH